MGADSIPISELERLDDALLLRRSAAGDTEAFGELHARHAAPVLLVAQRILGSRAAAEDIAQEAFLQLWRHADRFVPDRGSLRAWLLVLTRSRALDALRREKVRARAVERAHSPRRGEGFVLAEDELLRRERTRDLARGLARLPVAQTRVLGLLYLGGRTQAEVATALDVPLGTVKGRTRLGLRKLRRDLEHHRAA